MFYVYILYSQQDNGLYIGYTTDINRRLIQHNAGESISTKHRRPLILIYYEAYMNKQDAQGREVFLKSGAGRRFLKKQLKHTNAEFKIN